MNNFEILIDILKNDQQFFENITDWQIIGKRPGIIESIPIGIHPDLVISLIQNNFKTLYSHQVQALAAITRHQNIVISTGTSSGKSLCYQIPILNSILEDSNSTALLLFPTKALTNDQLGGITSLISKLPGEHKIAPAIFDGDTPQSQRQRIRELSRIVLTNPDMIHIGMLPHHTKWANYFENLKYVVIDEIHIYRGVFGSHFSNVIRRLKRILDFYGAKPIFIMTSATIGNPKELASRLVESSVELVDEDGSPKGEQNLLIYNPPLINVDLGVREGVMHSIEKFMSTILPLKIQTLVFCRTRKFVELLVRESQILFKNVSGVIRGYRSGYLRDERREIEQGLKNGEIQFGIATNALELGVDIGGVDIVILAGYPGTIAALKQRSGRAGRSLNPSLALFIASMNPLDQFLAKNPAYLYSKNIEHALVNPDNPLILLEHLQSSAFELPFLQSDGYGDLEKQILDSYLDYLVEQGVLHQKSGKYFWVADDYPSSHISLRSASANKILLETGSDGNRKVIGDVDYSSGLWMVHPGAVYIHNGETFLVKELNLDRNVAVLEECDEAYYTEPVVSVDIQVLEVKKEKGFDSHTLKYGDIQVKTKVSGYKRINWSTREVINQVEIEMPETTLLTCAYWMEISDESIEKMRSSGIWRSDKNEYGPDWQKIREAVRKRDGYSCQSCGKPEGISEHHVHHKIPFKMFTSFQHANQISNLVTLCNDCHRIVESQIRIRSAISGLKNVLENLSPIFVMCDKNDLCSFADPAAKFANKKPVVIFYDSLPAGIGLSEELFNLSRETLIAARDLIDKCKCADGCPSCVGPTLETSLGGKKETRELIELLLNS